ncbi:hypothetical protein DIPPA_00136 [Diplonema papillatum]|nr:hypothetical protein DIPPA_00136 [Diplonema papillatum]
MSEASESEQSHDRPHATEDAVNSCDVAPCRPTGPLEGTPKPPARPAAAKRTLPFPPQRPPLFNNVLSTTPAAPASSLSSRPRAVPPQLTPGPGSYDIKPIRSAACPRFARPTPRYGRRQSDSVPGPGSYDILTPMRDPSKPTTGVVPGATLSPRLPDVSLRKNVPAPGAYEVASCFAAAGAAGGRPAKAGFSFGKCSRDQHGGIFSWTKTPGPGSYDAAPKKKPRAGFTLGAKWKTPRRPSVPGPGAYEEMSAMASSKGGFTIKGRLPLYDAKLGQGPASDYNVRPAALTVPQ